MVIGYYQIRSVLPQLSEQEIERFLRPLGESIGEELCPVSLEDYCAAEFALLYVASGGSETYFREVFKYMEGRPCYILTSGDSNSLAASMEILSYIRSHGGTGEILHGDIPSIAKRIRTLCNALRAKKRLFGKRIGVIGQPSDWLIASDFHAETVGKKLGIESVYIPMDELVAEIERSEYVPDRHTDMLQEQPFDAAEMEKALYVYGALQRLAEKHCLSALTVRCFDLLTRVHATGCIGLAILNANGIYAGCEGDIPALLSMMILGEVSGAPVFQCNPSCIDSANKTLQAAHCTLPLDMPETFTLDTHFESKIGVAVKAELPCTDCTVFKASGDLARHFVAEGTILGAPYEETLCRTQVTVALGDVSYFLKDPIGNHHLLCLGRHADAINEFFNLL